MTTQSDHKRRKFTEIILRRMFDTPEANRVLGVSIREIMQVASPITEDELKAAASILLEEHPSDREIFNLRKECGAEALKRDIV